MVNVQTLKVVGILSLILIAVSIYSQLYPGIPVETFQSGGDALEINSVESEMENGQKLFVLFYAPWCGHCKRVMPVWQDLAGKYSNAPNVKVRQLNCDEHGQEAEKHEIQGFPTIILFKDGQKYVFEGERTAEGLEQFVNMH